MAENTEPQDRKKAYHPKSEMFKFVCDTGTIEIPYVENVPRKLARKAIQTAREGGDSDDVLFGALMDKKSLKVLEDMTLGEYDRFTDDWNKESAISLGE